MLTPLVAGPAFLMVWAAMTLLSYPSYVNLMRKAGMNPKHTFFPFPKFIFLWNMYVPGVAKKVLHGEDVASARFAETSAEKTVKLPSGTKKVLFWYPILNTFGALYGFIQLLWPMGLFTLSTLAPVAGLLVLGTWIRYAWDKGIAKRILPPSVERKFHHSLVDFVAKGAAGYLAPIAISVYLLTANPLFSVALFSLGMFMNAVWAAFNGMGFSAAAHAYLVEQKWQKDEAIKELRKKVDSGELPLTPQQERFLFTDFATLKDEEAALAALPADLQAISRQKKVSIKFADNFSSFLYDGSGLDLILPRRAYEAIAKVVGKIIRIPLRITGWSLKYLLPIGLAALGAHRWHKAYDDAHPQGDPTHKAQAPEGGKMYLFGWLDHATNSPRFYCLEAGTGEKVDAPFRFINFAELRSKESFPLDEVREACGQGKAVYFELEPWQGAGFPDLLDKILRGELDGELDAFAEGAARFDGPLFLSFGHEMNSDQHPWGMKPELYVRAYRHVHDRITRIAPNVTFVWNPYLDSPENLDRYYPGGTNAAGAPYVDFIGVSFFHHSGQSVAQLVERIDATLKALKKYGKPVVISRFGSSAGENEKRQFIEEITRHFEEWQIKGFGYFNFSTVSEKGEFVDFTLSGDALEAYHDALGRLDLDGNIVTAAGELRGREVQPPQNCAEVERAYTNAGQIKGIEKLRNTIARLEGVLASGEGYVHTGDIHESNRFRLSLADSYRDLYRIYKELKLDREKIDAIGRAVLHLQNGLNDMERTIQFHPSIPYIREYFDLLLSLADIYLETEQDNMALHWLYQLDQKLSDWETILAQNINSESVPGYQSRANLIRAQLLERQREYDRAGLLYRQIDLWATAEQAKGFTLPLVNINPVLGLAGENQRDLRFIAVMAKLGEARIGLNQLYREGGANDQVLSKLNEILRWREALSEGGFMDRGIEALILAMEYCLVSSESVEVARMKFENLPWSYINGSDLARKLGLQNINLTRRGIDKWGLVARGLPNLFLQDERLKEAITVIQESANNQ
jgi:hypothetical protein